MPTIDTVPLRHPTCDRYAVGDLVLDLGRRQVCRGQAVLDVAGLSFDLLAALARAAPNLVSQEDLLKQVWGRQIVGPETISQRVKLVRDALGDDAREPRYIAAVRGHGYRLIAPVSRVAPQPASSVAAAQEPAVDVRSETVIPPTGSSAAAPPESARAAASLRRVVLAALAIAVALAVAVTLRGRWEAEPTAEASVRPVSRLPERTVAVLPFLNLSPQADRDYVARGIAEAVLHQLAGSPQIAVIARGSSFAFKTRDVDVREIGRRLQARYLLDGSVQVSDGQLRIGTQLIDAETGREVWSLRFDRPLGDLFVVQDEIASKVARTLSSSLEPAGRGIIMGQGTTDLDAYLAFMQGRALLGSRTIDDTSAAIERFQHALRLDPRFAPAHAALASAYVLLAQIPEDWEPADDRAFERARPHIERALELDPENGEAMVARGVLAARAREDQRAEVDMRRGLALSPNFVQGYEHLAEFLFYQSRRAEEAYGLLDRARQLDPLAPRAPYLRARFAIHALRTDEAERLLLETLRADPNFYPALMRLGQIYWNARGELARAIRYGEQALALEPRADWARRYLVHFYVDLGMPAAARDVIASSGREQDEARIVIEAYEGDWAAAASILLGPRAPRLGPTAVDICSFVVREHARRVGDRRAARRWLETRLAENVQRLGPAIRRFYRFDVLALADLLGDAGDHVQERTLVRESLASIAIESREAGRAAGVLLRQRALAHALDGRHDAAVNDLAEFLSGGGLRHFWYDLDRQSAFEPLRGTAHFEALRTEYRARLARQRQELEALQRLRLVPPRPTVPVPLRRDAELVAPQVAG
jgi:TolB-like protein/DNA-binding winged helix-turn-helix (wHTH) protein/Tfp pilus assembly protein PilF